MSALVLHAWRHPPARGAAGLCIGRTDLPVDPRRAKRQAHRMRRFARRQGLPRIVVTSPLARCREVGRWLARWGWQHRIAVDLLELDFGAWDGQPWAGVPREDFDAWCADFPHHRPGGGESVAALLQPIHGDRLAKSVAVRQPVFWLLAGTFFVCGASTNGLIGTHLIHEVTSPQAFVILRDRGLKVRRPDLTLATMDHATPTRTEQVFGGAPITIASAQNEPAGIVVAGDWVIWANHDGTIVRAPKPAR